ncbi:hypothetical protein [Microlunatus ginsengisoli]|uniref:OTU domain-containing protein n=1 Tax=Microlunatus ginsengisoli TaxID=363863 RepID=A0ABP7AIR7_9ACTN
MPYPHRRSGIDAPVADRPITAPRAPAAVSSTIPPAASLISSLQRVAGNRAVQQLLGGRRLAAAPPATVQRQIIIGAAEADGDAQPLVLGGQVALDLLVDHYPEVFGGEVLLETASFYLAILQVMEASHRRFATIGDLAAAVEQERRNQLRDPSATAETAPARGLDGPAPASPSSGEVSRGGPEVATADYHGNAIRQYRLSMAHGHAWGSEAEATVVAESLGVRFRIYHFADERAAAPTYHVEVGVAGPIYPLHFDPTPGHYSLLTLDPHGRFLLHGNRYRLVEVARDGDCLFSAAFQAANGRAPSAEDVRGLRAVAASMVPPDVIAHMLAQVEPAQPAVKDPSAQGGEPAQGKRKRDDKAKDLAPFMSRINYLLNRYPNLFYLLRAQHSDFGQLFGGFSETRLALFYNDALMPKRPVAAEQRESARLGPDDLRLPALPEPADPREAADQLELVLSRARDVVNRLRLSQAPAQVLYEPLTPEEMGEWEEAIREGMEHHTSRDEFALNPRTRATTLDERDASPGGGTAERAASSRRSEAIAIPLPSDDIEAAKAFREEYVYNSNASDKSDFYQPDVRERQTAEMRDQRRDAALAPLREGTLKLHANEEHSEQLMLAGGPWEAITTIALETAWREATRADERSAEPRPDLRAVQTPHTFTVVINRAACPACTDTLVAAIRLFWRACEELFGLAPGTGRTALGKIFRFELSVTGMYTAGNGDSTTANDLAALTVSGWTIGLHHDKSGGLAPQGYALVEALYGHHERGEVNSLVGQGRESIKPISAAGKLALGHARKFKEPKMTHRPPGQRAADLTALTMLLDGKSSARAVIAAAKGFLSQAATELANYPDLDSDTFTRSAEKLVETRLTAAAEYGNDNLAGLRGYLSAVLTALYDLLDEQRLDKL